MKLNSDKCNLLVCGHKFECMICKTENSHIIETHLVKLLGIKIESELTFNNYMEAVCKKASQKLNALSRLCFIIPFQKRKILMHAFFDSQFSYSPLVWMFHSRRINTKINNLFSPDKLLLSPKFRTENFSALFLVLYYSLFTSMILK